MNPRRLLEDLTRFPWWSTALTLRERFREDRLGMSASSLTFTTTMALVPFFTVAPALFTAFPIFGKLQANLQTGWCRAWCRMPSPAGARLPDAVRGQGEPARLRRLAALVVTALALVLTIDRTLNGIWRVRRPRPLAQRVLIYWAAITLGPMLMAVSLSTTAWVVSASRGLVGAPRGAMGSLGILLDLFEFLLLAAALMALYRFVPNTPVRRSHAMVGGIFGALGLEVAKRLLAWYISLVPTYSAVYGAFATLPILLVWIYIAG
ncbi:YihY family inner membrane protein [Ramlibacter terrae]|uniref:YihY family inner membrane protein n=1 Tax=Ramlibacter terrae TaxID=2732511 RepID=A0ABX6P4Q4_9BURK|nr:YihY family inner membrane protein [Ramlibacter terrae]